MNHSRGSVQWESSLACIGAWFWSLGDGREIPIYGNGIVDIKTRTLQMESREVNKIEFSTSCVSYQ